MVIRSPMTNQLLLKKKPVVRKRKSVPKKATMMTLMKMMNQLLQRKKLVERKKRNVLLMKMAI